MSYSICKYQKDGDFVNLSSFSSNVQLIYGVQKLVQSRKIYDYFWNLHTDSVTQKLTFLGKISKHGQTCHCKKLNNIFDEKYCFYVFLFIDEMIFVFFVRKCVLSRLSRKT